MLGNVEGKAGCRKKRERSLLPLPLLVLWLKSAAQPRGKTPAFSILLMNIYKTLSDTKADRRIIYWNDIFNKN